MKVVKDTLLTQLVLHPSYLMVKLKGATCMLQGETAHCIYSVCLLSRIIFQVELLNAHVAGLPL